MFHKYLLGILKYQSLLQGTEVHFASFLSGGFITAVVVNSGMLISPVNIYETFSLKGLLRQTLQEHLKKDVSFSWL